MLFTMTVDQYHYFEEEMIGLCRCCKAERDCTESDAENYPCDDCGENEVFGVPELLIMGEVDICD